VKIARVIGTVVCSIKHPDHVGAKLLLVGPVDADGNAAEPVFVAIDAAQAGIGDYVLVVEEGKSARQVLQSKTAPVEAIVIGVIDTLHTGGTLRQLAPETGKEQ
jgi:microcompartment protein CcmK/EutM